METYMWLLTMMWIFLNQISSLSGTPCSKYKFVESEQAFYKVHRQLKNWYDAYATCALEGATLLYPDTVTESALMLNLLEAIGVDKKTQVWVGAHDYFMEGTFVKLNGEELCYAPWHLNEPNYSTDNADDCVLAEGGLLRDAPCDRLRVFLCKKSFSNSVTDSICQTLDPAYVPNWDNSSCYKLHLQPKTWHEAYAVCSGEDSYLAVINSRREAEFLVQLIKNQSTEQTKVPYYKGHISIGFHDMFKEGKYMTIHGETLEQANYYEWQGGQPDNYKSKEDCGSITRDGKLNDIDCQTVMLFICERNITTYPKALDGNLVTRPY